MPTSPSASTAEVPTAATAGPTTPPISAWEELEGRPKYQVIRFQLIAPIRPAKTIVGVITSGLTTSVATVAATESERKAPTKLRIAAIAIATRGGAAPVEIVVATTLAVSWKPFVKSKASAVPTTMTRMTSELKSAQLFLMTMPSRIWAAVSVASIAFSSTANMSFQRITTIGSIPFEKSEATASREIRSPSFSSRWISIQYLSRSLNSSQVVEALGQLLAGRDQDLGQGPRLLHRRLDLVEPEEVGGLLGEVDDVVHLGREAVDVLAVDRGDEGLVEPLDDVVGDPVALLLGLQHVAGEAALVGPHVHHLVEQLRRAYGVPPRLAEQVEEGAIPRKK